jgi:hypothetical protein
MEESQPSNNDDVIRKLVQKARRDGDSKSVFGLLLLIEREILAEAKGNSLPKAKLACHHPPNELFRSYSE